MKKNDFILIMVLLLIAAGSYGAIRMAQNSAEVSDITGSVQATDSQSTEAEVTSDTAEGGSADSGADGSDKADSDVDESSSAGTDSQATTDSNQSSSVDSDAQAESGGAEGSDASPAQAPSATQTRTVNAIRITVGNEEFGVYSLEEDQVIDIGGTNVLEIKDGKAAMSHAECPDQLCMSMGPVDSPYDLIVCLPNLVVVEGIQGKVESKVPATEKSESLTENTIPAIDGVS